MSHIVRTVYFRETLAMFRSPAFYTGLVGFLSLSSGLFFTALQIGEGTFWSVSALWVLAIALPMPLLVILLTMPLFASERASGTLTLMVILPISLRRVILGKFLAAYGGVLLGIFGGFVPWLFLAHGLAGKLPPVSALVPATLMLGLHGMSWAALGVLCSALARRPWAAAIGTILIGGGAILAWAALSRLLLGGPFQAAAFPLVEELLDAAAGRIALRSLVLHASIVVWCLYMTLHVLEARR